MQELEQVLRRLEELTIEAQRTQQRWGYFAALFRRMVRRVDLELGQSQFQDPTLTVSLVRGLTDTYFRVLLAFKANAPLPRSWELAFEATRLAEFSVEDHLRLGMAALLHLDFGAVAANVARGRPYESLGHDFAALNGIFYDELWVAERCLRRGSLAHRLGFRSSRRGDEWLARLARRVLYESSWDFGRKLSELDPAFWAISISDRDSLVADIACMIRASASPWNLSGLLSAASAEKRVAKNLERLG